MKKSWIGALFGALCVMLAACGDVNKDGTSDLVTPAIDAGVDVQVGNDKDNDGVNDSVDCDNSSQCGGLAGAVVATNNHDAYCNCIAKFALTNSCHVDCSATSADAGTDASVDAAKPECTTDMGCFDGNPTTVDICNAGVCKHVSVQCTSDSQCSNGQICDGMETCDKQTFTCVRGTAPTCDDGDSYTVDSCDPVNNACAHLRVDCIANFDCADMSACNGVEKCVSGKCVAGTATNCSDGDPNTVDTCQEPFGTCTHTVKGCTTNAQCDNGIYCDGTEICNTITGACVAGASVNCDDGNVSTIDSCSNTLRSCTHTPTGCVSDSQCQDSLFCNGSERCVSGSCVAGAAINCSAGFTCSESLDACVQNSTCTSGNTQQCSISCSNGTVYGSQTCSGGSWSTCSATCPSTQCVNGNSQSCSLSCSNGTTAFGSQTCSNNVWGSCNAVCGGTQCTNGSQQSCSVSCNGTTQWGNQTCNNNVWGSCSAVCSGGTCSTNTTTITMTPSFSLASGVSMSFSSMNWHAAQDCGTFVSGTTYSSSQSYAATVALGQLAKINAEVSSVNGSYMTQDPNYSSMNITVSGWLCQEPLRSGDVEMPLGSVTATDNGGQLFMRGRLRPGNTLNVGECGFAHNAKHANQYVCELWCNPHGNSGSMQIPQ